MPTPYFTPHALERMAKRRIRREAVEFVCETFSQHRYDPDNDSYELWGDVAEGRLCVAVTAESFYEPQKIIKSAYYD